MQAKIFYSWQEDVSSATCSALISDALRTSVRELVEDGTTKVEPVLDRDTANVPGAPDIGLTIFDKIREADVFVADVTIIGRISGRERPTPNPNVLVEIGYALAALGPARILLVMNTAFGPPEQLPFDLRQRRTVTFDTGKDDLERDAAKRHLTSECRVALAAMLKERASTHMGNDGPQVASWRKLLMEAQAARKPLILDSEIVLDTGFKDISGRKVTAPALLDGTVSVRAVNEQTFDLGFPVRGRSGITIVPTPFSVVVGVWDGGEGYLHVLLNRKILLEDGTSRFI